MEKNVSNLEIFGVIRQMRTLILLLFFFVVFMMIFATSENV
jgi:hypothetical protein